MKREHLETRVRGYLNHWGPQMADPDRAGEEPSIRTIIKNYYMGYFPPADAARMADEYVARFVENLLDST